MNKRKPKEVSIIEHRECWWVRQGRYGRIEAIFNKPDYTRKEVEQWVKDRPKLFTLVGQVEGAGD